jgi:hypothetical protein
MRKAQSLLCSTASMIVLSCLSVHAVGQGIAVPRGQCLDQGCPIPHALDPKVQEHGVQTQGGLHEGKKVRIDHTWMSDGVWMTYAGPGCEGTCPIAGHVWIVPVENCSSASSYAVGNDLLYAQCGSTYEKTCPEQIPCGE